MSKTTLEVGWSFILWSIRSLQYLDDQSSRSSCFINVALHAAFNLIVLLITFPLSFRICSSVDKGFDDFNMSREVRAATLVDGPASGIYVVQV